MMQPSIQIKNFDMHIPLIMTEEYKWSQEHRDSGIQLANKAYTWQHAWPLLF
jgi:hypothetical protein